MNDYLRVLNDHDLARSLGVHGRQNVETQYSGLIHAERFFEIAKSVVDNAPTGEQAAAADFVLGLLKKIREANDKIFRLDNRPNFQK